MTYLPTMQLPVVAVLTALFFLLAVGQALHVLFLATRKDERALSAIMLYEALLLAHLMLACAVALSAYCNNGEILLRLRVVSVPIEPLLWANCATAALGAILAVRYRTPLMLPEIALVGACCPPIISAIGPAEPYLLIADASFFAFRLSAGLVFDVRRLRAGATRLSAIEAVDRLPEGLAMANASGRILYMNDAMRACLVALGFATDLSDVSHLWDNLNAIAHCADHPASNVLPEGVRIHIAPGHVRLFARDLIKVQGASYRRLVAIDVTEAEALNFDIARTNDLLQAANRELEASLANVRKVADNEAMLHMKARVHDVIGQRLSILHRFLEDENASEQTLERVAELTRTMLDDLASPHTGQAHAQLASLVEAFSLAGVQVALHGDLPDSAAAADAFAAIAREAATNAVKHGRASAVCVALTSDEHAYTMRISNDGVAGGETTREGTGLPSMRAAARAAGGTCSVVAQQPFTLETVIPR